MANGSLCLLVLLSMFGLSFGDASNGSSQACSQDLVHLQKAYEEVYSTLNCTDPGDQNFIDLVEAEGFQVERHFVTTSDGYILTLHRLICKDPCQVEVKGPVLFIPGLQQTTVCFVWNPANESLSFLMKKAGYDVWLLNPRGTGYSLSHVNISCHEPGFWNFSMDQSGRFDVPQTMDYILSRTGKSKMRVVTHSMGGSLLLATLSTLHKYNQKISLAALMVPGAIMTNSPYPAFAQAKLAKPILQCLSGPAFLGENVIKTDGKTCQMIPVFKGACGGPLLNRGDIEDPLYFNESRTPIYEENTPQVASIGCFSHYIQLKLVDDFQQYDYGEQGNLDIYKQVTPPVYQLDRVTAPLLVLTAQNDTLVSATDQAKLKSKLPNLVCRGKQLELPNATHRDFIFSKNPKASRYDLIICMFDKSLRSRATDKHCGECLSQTN